MTRAVRSWWLVAATAVAACDGTSPGGLEGRYQLVELNTQPLSYDHVLGCCIYTDGSFTLTTGTYEASITFQNRNNGMVSTVNEQGTYTPSAGSLTVQRMGGTFVFHLFNIRVEGRTIRLQLGGNGPGAADQFAAAFRR